MKNRMKYLVYPYGIWMAIVIVVPLLLILFYSLTSGNIHDMRDLSFSLDSFKKAIDPMYFKVILKSLYLAVISTFACLVLGYPMAMIIANEKAKRRNTLLLFFLVPMWMNFLLRTYAWMTILSRNGIINTIVKAIGFEGLELMPSQGAVVLGMIYNFLPFMVLPIYTALSKMDKKLLEAASDLGANNIRVFFKVVFPLSIPGVVTGITMVFMPAVSTFVISKLLGGGKEELIGNLIERQITMQNDWHFGSALAIILMIIIVLSMTIMRRVDNEKGGAAAW